MTERTKKKSIWKIIGIGLALAGLLAAWAGYTVYTGFFKANVTDRESHLYVHTGWTFDQVMSEIHSRDILKNEKSFRWAAEKMNYPERVKAGRYRLEPGMGNRSLINRLGGGHQDPVKLRFQNIRLKEDFAGLISRQIEADSILLIKLLNDTSHAKTYGFTKDNFYTLFIPNTYEFYWNTSAEQFVERMHKEYQRFWTEERLQKAQSLGMSPQEVSVLASIVRGEAMHNSEMPVIAGLYINRLRKGMLLQADPTVIFANNDFSIRRVLYRHLKVDSPYNTYLYAGLPPGPINMPSIAAIDAVLDYQRHDYIYMCVKEDFSGYHRFAVNEAEHYANARLFQRALNERNIMR